MSELRESFYAWVMQQTIAGHDAQVLDEDHLVFGTEARQAHVIFLTHDEQPLVELRVGSLGVCEAPFLTHFVLKDRWRPRELFRDMAHAFEAESRHAVQRIVLCGEREPAVEELLANLRTCEDQLPLRCEFVHLSPLDALTDVRPASAIILTPGAHEFQQELFRTHRHAVTFCLPDWVFASRDAFAMVRLLLEALGEPEPRPLQSGPVVPERPLPRAGRVLVLNVMYRDRSVRMGYRMYDDYRATIRGAVTKPRVTMRDIDDLFDTLLVKGVSKDSIDAMAIMVPGVVNFCSMNLPSLGVRDNEVAEKLERAYGIPVFVDNNTNAAAMGCYYLDAEHESLTLYRHQLGHKNGGQGTVLDGRLVVGRNGLAGEPKFYQRHFKYNSYEHGYAQAVWSERGLQEIAQNVLLATIGTVSPEVAYLAIGAVNDACGIARTLERKLPKYCIPDLEIVHDYRERMYLGEVALCLGRVSQGDRHRDS